jgi:hypothetical protein
MTEQANTRCTVFFRGKIEEANTWCTGFFRGKIIQANTSCPGFFRGKIQHANTWCTSLFCSKIEQANTWCTGLVRVKTEHVDPCCQSLQQSSIVEIHRGGDTIFMLHQKGLFNRCQFALSLEVNAVDSPVGGGVMAIRVRSLLTIKPTVQYCKYSPWRVHNLSVTPERVIQQLPVYF